MRERGPSQERAARQIPGADVPAAPMTRPSRPVVPEAPLTEADAVRMRLGRTPQAGLQSRARGLEPGHSSCRRERLVTWEGQTPSSSEFLDPEHRPQNCPSEPGTVSLCVVRVVGWKRCTGAKARQTKWTEVSYMNGDPDSSVTHLQHCHLSPIS